MKSHFSVRFLTKPYLKKFLLSINGGPCFRDDEAFGLMLALGLEKPVEVGTAHKYIISALERYDCELTLYFPAAWLAKRTHGHAMDPKHNVYYNKILDGLFDQQLAQWCAIYRAGGLSNTRAIEEYCERHNIKLEEDIGRDALIKREIRYRNRAAGKPGKKVALNLSSRLFALRQAS